NLQLLPVQWGGLLSISGGGRLWHGLPVVRRPAGRRGLRRQRVADRHGVPRYGLRGRGLSEQSQYGRIRRVRLLTLGRRFVRRLLVGALLLLGGLGMAAPPAHAQYCGTALGGNAHNIYSSFYTSGI